MMADNKNLYYTWQGMIRRCYSVMHHKYHNYGARGIKVCDEWRQDFGKFVTWARANGYANGLSIDRIDDNGDYEPSNCRWTDAVTQCNNKRNNRYLRINGEVHSVADWARIYGIAYVTMSKKAHRFETVDYITYCKSRGYTV